MSQSCGRQTWRMRAHASGSLRCSHESLVMVSAGTGTLPTASAHASGPPSFLISQPTSGAVSVSFQSFAGRTGVPCSSVATMPCCCPATEIASTRGAPASAHAASNAVHQASGSCSLRGGEVCGWRALPLATSAPVSASLTSTFVDCVDESMPATRAMAPLSPTSHDAPPWPAGHDAAGQTERTHGCSSEWSVWGAWEQGSSAA